MATAPRWGRAACHFPRTAGARKNKQKQKQKPHEKCMGLIRVLRVSMPSRRMKRGATTLVDTYHEQSDSAVTLDTRETPLPMPTPHQSDTP